MDLKTDRFHIVYRPKEVTTEQMLAAIQSKGFEGKVVEDDSNDKDEDAKIRHDISKAPPELQAAAEAARKADKPLLLAFHGPG